MRLVGRKFTSLVVSVSSAKGECITKFHYSLKCSCFFFVQLNQSYALWQAKIRYAIAAMQMRVLPKLALRYIAPVVGFNMRDL